MGDEENVDDQQNQGVWSIDDWSGFEPIPEAQTEMQGPHGCHEHHEPVEQSTGISADEGLEAEAGATGVAQGCEPPVGV